MDRIQTSFNALRDLNEKIDFYYQNKKGLISRIIKGMAAFMIFILLSLGFAAYKSLSAGIETVKPLFAAAAISGFIVLAGVFAVFTIRKKEPAQLLETKKQRENELLELLNKNNFPVADFKTGEIYDFLFQYFEDFITFRDIRNELSDLRKRVSSTVTFTEKEKKLDTLNEKLEETVSAIAEMLAGLDQSVHPVPEVPDIDHTVAEVTALIKELEAKINHEKSIISKLEKQFSEQPGSEVNLLEIEAELNDINSRMEALKAEADTAEFLEEIFREASVSFLKKREEEFMPLLSANISKLTGYRGDEKISEAAGMLFDDKNSLSELDIRSRLVFSLAVRSALSVFFRDFNIPPMLLIDPLDSLQYENVEEKKKILLELFGNRQVIIFTSGTGSGTD